ncbi:hypothetical protein COV19_01300 [Candidatus Woesearchaeota archaeon CG10_big_fil_rev_8_21_14_0_10_44_13]|nr:MAG: hypothetical protein COV19_01300 [Candidatus Woesearchaeota archaeon CG10_big_fil_rev_8_21_14_0_10_44_13]
MGWFSGIFRKKEQELQKAYVNVDGLQQWFDSRAEIRIENIRESIKEDLDKINQLSEQIKTSSAVLQEAKLRNENIPERAIQIMEGNRKSYLHAVSNFVGKIQAPSTINFNSVSEFVSQFENNITSFAKMSSRNFHVLQEFFAHESGEIAQSVKDIDFTVRSMLDNEYKRINTLSSNISKVNDLLKKKETAEIMMEDHSREKAELLRQIDEAKKGIEDVKKTKDYRFFLETERSKEQLARQMKDVEKRLFELFAPLDRPLRKFAKISADGERLINAYSGSPLNAALDDNEFKILGLLDKMKGLLERGELELKDKAKEKAINQINAITSQVLRDSVAEYNNIKETYSERERSLKMNNSLHAQNEFEYKLNHLQDKLGKVEKNMEKLEKFIEMPELDSALDIIKKDILEVFSTEITVRFDNKGKKGAE